MPAAVLALGDLAFESRVIDRVVLDFHRHPLDVRVVRRPLGHRPAFQRIAHLQAEVVVPSAGVVQLHHEQRALSLRQLLAGLGLARLRKLPFAPVLRQAHRKAPSRTPVMRPPPYMPRAWALPAARPCCMQVGTGSATTATRRHAHGNEAAYDDARDDSDSAGGTRNGTPIQSRCEENGAFENFDLEGAANACAADSIRVQKFLYCQVQYSACVAGSRAECASPVQASPFPRRSLSLPWRLAGPLHNNKIPEGSPE